MPTNHDDHVAPVDNDDRSSHDHKLDHYYVDHNGEHDLHYDATPHYNIPVHVFHANYIERPRWHDHDDFPGTAGHVHNHDDRALIHEHTHNDAVYYEHSAELFHHPDDADSASDEPRTRHTHPTTNGRGPGT